MDWLWWVGAALVLIVIEIVSLDLVLIMFAGGALAAGVANALGAPIWWQIVIFGVVSVLLLVALRPWLLRRLKTRMPLVETNTAAHVGRPAVVVSEVSELGGRIKLAGEVWTARTAVEDLRLPAGTEVRVIAIDGATAVVEPQDATPPSAQPPRQPEPPARPEQPARPEHKESA